MHLGQVHLLSVFIGKVQQLTKAFRLVQALAAQVNNGIADAGATTLHSNNSSSSSNNKRASNAIVPTHATDNVFRVARISSNPINHYNNNNNNNLSNRICNTNLDLSITIIKGFLMDKTLIVEDGEAGHVDVAVVDSYLETRTHSSSTMIMILNRPILNLKN